MANTRERSQQPFVEVRQHLAHHDPFLKAIDQETVAVGSVVTKDPRAEAVESRDPGFALVVLEPLVDAARDLAGRTGREGQDKDLVATGHALAHCLLVKVDQGMCLSRARSSQHTKWSGYFMDVEFMDVEWQQVSGSGAGDLIMRGLVSWSQPRLSRAARPRPGRRPERRARTTASGSAQESGPPRTGTDWPAATLPRAERAMPASGALPMRGIPRRRAGRGPPDEGRAR